MNAKLHGFDASYQIDHDSLLAALENLVTDQVAMRLAATDLFVPLPAPAPANTIQHGSLRVISPPMTMLDSSNTNLTITFPSTLLQLDSVAGAAGFGGIGALAPTAAGALVIHFVLGFGGESSGQNGRITIGATVTVDNLASTEPLQTTLTNTLATISPVISLLPLVRTAVRLAAQNALAALFPIPIEFPIDPPDAACDIGVRSFGVKLLNGTTSTKPALGFFVKLLADSAPDFDALTESSVPTNSAAAFALSNRFLKEFLCCVFRHSPDIAGLPEHQDDPNRPDCCVWTNIDNVQLADQKVKIAELSICIVQDGDAAKISLSVHATQSGTGWTAHARFTCDFTLGNDGGVLGVAQVNPLSETWQDVSPWVWVIVGLAAALGALAGAVIGFFVGGWAGAGAGAWKGGVIGASVGIALLVGAYAGLKAIGALASQAINGALGAFGAGNMKLLPDAIPLNFGTFKDVVHVDFDDLLVAGHAQPPRRDDIEHEGADVVLQLGDKIDLDRGVVQRAGETQTGFALEGDIEWQRVPPVLALARTISTPSTPSTSASESTAIAARVFVGNPFDTGAFHYDGAIAALATAR